MLSRPEPAPAERRVAPRTELTILCTTSFSINEQEKRAILLDLSRSGARFGTAAAVGTLSLSPGQVLDFNLVTPFGTTTCRGKVMWTETADVLYTWGVQFTDPPQGDAEPLKVLLAPTL
jgi:hypothetical protein